MDRDVTQDQAEAAPTVGREELLQVLLGAGVGQVPHKEPPRVSQVFLLLILPERSALPGHGTLWGTTGSGGLLFPEHLDIASTCMKTGARAAVCLPRSPQPLLCCSSEPVAPTCDCVCSAWFPRIELDSLGLHSPWQCSQGPEELEGYPRPQELAIGYWDLPITPVADLGWRHMTTHPGVLME